MKPYQGKEVLRVFAKCSDMFTATLIDRNGETLKEHDGYVPSMMPGEHFGKYVEIDIDIATGQILNWKKPSKATIAKFIKKGE
jgi:hypothetical protein